MPRLTGPNGLNGPRRKFLLDGGLHPTAVARRSPKKEFCKALGRLLRLLRPHPAYLGCECNANERNMIFLLLKHDFKTGKNTPQRSWCCEVFSFCRTQCSHIGDKFKVASGVSYGGWPEWPPVAERSGVRGRREPVFDPLRQSD